MNDPAVTIRFDGDVRVYQPGKTLCGEYRIQGLKPGQINISSGENLRKIKRAIQTDYAR